MSFVYDKIKDFKISVIAVKVRNDADSGFIVAMNQNLEIFYFAQTSRAMLAFITASACKVSDIFDRWRLEYDVDDETLKSDISSFIRDLQWKKLVVLSV